MSNVLPKDTDKRSEIKKYLKSKGTRQTWLSANLGINNVRLNEILNLHRTLTDDMKNRINELLNTNF